MLGGAAGGARSRPPTDLHQGAARFPLYSLFPTPGSNRPTLHKVTESLFATSLSTLGVPTPPPNSPYSLQLELLNCSQRLLVTDKDKMDEAKLGKGCLPDSLCCPGDRQVIDGLGVMQPLTIKTEQAKRSCNTCLTNSPKKVVHTEGGCSRTNPVTWLGVAGQNVQVQVKREPQHVHVSELVAVKLEQASPGNKPDHPPSIPASLNNGSIPVGIAVARQRVGDAGLLAALSQKDNQQRMHDIDAAQAAMTVGVANVLCDDRPAPLAWPAPPPAAPPAPLWQYPTAQVSMESMMVGGVGVGGVGPVGGGVSSMGGYQLVREPTTGALLLLPAPPDLPHTVVWGGVPYPSAPLLLPPAPHPSHLQLLPGDLLASTATLQHTHTHSTRLVTLAPAPQPQPHPSHTDKRKPIIQPLLTPHALIKIEPEPPQEKPPPPQFAPEPMQQPVMTTHLYYQPDFAEQACRSQATSPAAPPTPPPETPEVPAHRDASNQTDHIDDDDDSPNQADEDERDVACIGVAHFPEESSAMMQTQTSILQPGLSSVASIDSAEDSSSECLANSSVVGAVEKAIDAIERDESLDNSSSGGSNDLVIDTGSTSPISQPLSAQTSSRSMVDVSGLELLSNSIEQFERTTPGTSMPTLEPGPLTIDTRTSSKLNILIKTSPKSPRIAEPEQTRRFEFSTAEPSTSARAKPSLDGLGLLCALAEQRFMEEVVESPPPMSSRPFIKSEPLMSPTDRDRISQKKEKHRHRDGDSSSERKRKRSQDREERLRHKLDKMRRHKREREHDEGRGRGGELEASLRRITACSCGLSSCSHAPAVASAQDLVNAMEKDMRERLQDLQRQCDEKRAQLNALTPPLPALSTPSPASSTPALSPDSDRGSSKKRKVGRPRKVSSPDSTETIVAKKPKSKSSIVGYLLAKGKLKGGILCTRGEPSREDGRTSKVRPKLKAEPILKIHSEEDDNEWSLNRSASSSMESLNEVRQKNREKVDRLARKHSRDDLPELEFAMRRGSGSSDRDKERRRAKKRRKSVKSKDKNDGTTGEAGSSEPVVQAVSRCTLTEDKLDSSPRVLTAMGGLFYAGKLSAVQAPDVYAITLDGERGNKPHILSREETLRDAILEVSPTSVTELPSGSRICAYWSQQYRCLYPGTVAVSSPDPHDDKFVAVEFDDGDSGRIAIEDIRFLEPNYPVVEYENPLFTLGKRRRNTSVTEEKKVVPYTSAEVKSNSETRQKEQNEEDKHRDRKKLKKHRKEKMKRQSSEDDPTAGDYVKKKKKKHKCCEEHCKHRRHHKKHHRKHRKRHHSSCKEQSSSSGDDNQRHKSSSDYIDSNKSNEDSVDSNDRLSTLIAVEKSPDEKMKTVIKKAVLSKKALVKTAILDFSNLGKITLKKDEEPKDNLKDSGIGLEDEPMASTSDGGKKKTKKRTVSSSSDGACGGVSKMAAFLPGGALWRWHGPAYRRTARPRHRKLFYRAIQRGEEILNVGDAAVFLSTGRPDRPYIGRIVSLWEARGAMAVRVNWFYHPEETTGLTAPLHYPGGLFESPHMDENDVQTISHKCEVLPLAQYKERMGDDPVKYSTVYDNNDVYYLAGHYDPTQQSLRMESDIPFATTS
ncbi:protein winged eye-like isoform X2 [Plodia interpunctella]|uniref:protein winged eye-like isoform X2 n=1 Tax=Plodia interpunctella TaxID=58824 RepID=UPI0023682DEB|nr:protein winged eye-like isoform X2 [Plodia interpunctella]